MVGEEAVLTLDVGNLSQLCRVCLQMPEDGGGGGVQQFLDLTTIYDEDDQLTYAECFTICTQINLSAPSDENLPSNLCKSCGLELQMAYDFHKKVEESKRVLRMVIEGRTTTQLPAQTAVEDDPDEPRPDGETEGEDALTLPDMAVERLDGSEANFEMTEELIPLEDFEEADEDEDEDMPHACERTKNDSEPREERISQLSIERVAIAEASRDDYDELMSLARELNETEDGQEARLPQAPTIPQRPRAPRAPAALHGPPFPCELCGHLCTTRALLASHRHRKHRLKENPLPCPKCQKTFDTRRQLDRHLQRLTCDVYPEFVCEYCSKRCVGVANYNIHLRFHKRQYPFVCHLCAKRFMLATHLTNHIKTKHENQRFLCEFPDCGRKFQSQHSLRVHAYVHVDSLPYKCDYCGCMQPTKGRLRYHITKAHDIQHSLADLDRMLVAAKLQIRAKMQTVEPGVGEAPKDGQAKAKTKAKAKAP